MHVSISLPQRVQPVDDHEDVEMTNGEEAKVVVGPGETVTSDTAFMRGHGTYTEGDSLVASVAGVVERVNKLLSVRPLRTRFNGEIGDVVIGRVTEVVQKRWKLDINARQDAVLLLSSVNLPGGVQRRKSESDELQMRTFFAEGDLVSAEVQTFFADGAASVHTRSAKYGKVRKELLYLPETPHSSTHTP
ncbi:exosome component 2, isoform CRA_a [Blyttiomyces helicus]|uniref:Exosome complex component RRP4 n=1 Tax=Blyttiomyces helicus TaxID=388810 RepID=A0A4P9WC35_9FUNG|nr:exosome component 2, isoform CRA_a [Blyttiomyces helicus]|eukprot:RKO90064.1 exosome component 2, isoform CRA_a [Blyttiomyces helicus]